MNIAKNIAELRKTIPLHVKLVVVSKTQSIAAITEAYNAGERCFGENKVQELITKYPALPKDIEWHFLGHLQSNKVKYIAPYIDTIHSVDSLKILIEINKEAKKSNRIINCLLEMFIASESTKFGLDIAEAFAILDSGEYKAMDNIRISGLMGMATYTDDITVVRNEFGKLKTYFDTIKQKYFATNNAFKDISMGMSGDYPIAIECGATIVRIGTSIFGERNYQQ